MVYYQVLVVLGSYIKVADTGDGMEESKRVVCRRPLIHRPEFEGKYHCQHCARELEALK